MNFRSNAILSCVFGFSIILSAIPVKSQDIVGFAGALSEGASPKRIKILWDKSSSGKPLLDTLVSSFQQKGVTVSTQEYNVGDSARSIASGDANWNDYGAIICTSEDLRFCDTIYVEVEGRNGFEGKFFNRRLEER